MWTTWLWWWDQPSWATRRMIQWRSWQRYVQTFASEFCSYQVKPIKKISKATYLKILIFSIFFGTGVIFSNICVFSGWQPEGCGECPDRYIQRLLVPLPGRRRRQADAEVRDPRPPQPGHPLSPHAGPTAVCHAPGRSVFGQALGLALVWRQNNALLLRLLLSSCSLTKPLFSLEF